MHFIVALEMSIVPLLSWVHHPPSLWDMEQRRNIEDLKDSWLTEGQGRQLTRHRGVQCFLPDWRVVVEYCFSLTILLSENTTPEPHSLTRTNERDYINCHLATLHWLPAYFRIDFEELVITFKALHGPSAASVLCLCAWCTCTFQDAASIHFAGNPLI